MRILVLGAYGFIGSAIARELAARGHEVTGLGRECEYGRRILPQLRWVKADLSRMTGVESWSPLLEHMDAVVNASGLLQTGEGGSVEAVQLHAVRALVRACETAEIKHFVQVSAAGARPDASSDFMRTKAQADAVIESSSVPSLIVRPGLVIGRNSYGGTELIRSAAALPIAVRFPFRAPIRCIALSDLVEALAEAVGPLDPETGCFDLVEREPRSLDTIVAMHREWLGLPSQRWSTRLPHWLLDIVSRSADLLGHFGWRSPVRRNAVLALESGVDGDPEQSIALLRREPLSLKAILERQPAGKQDRLHARLSLVQPLVIASLIVMWAGSGLATLLQVDKAALILEPSGIGRQAAYAVAVGGGWADVILAAGLVWRRTVRPTLLAMIVLTAIIYLIGGSLLVPRLWAEPLAPFAKALPATLLALVAYWMLERR